MYNCGEFPSFVYLLFYHCQELLSLLTTEDGFPFIRPWSLNFSLGQCHVFFVHTHCSEMNRENSWLG